MSYDVLANQEAITHTIESLTKNGFAAVVVVTGKDALEKIKTMIPDKASVMDGSSRTLEQIEYVEYLKSNTHSWNNLHAAIVAETDRVKQNRLRKEATMADYYLGSVHALTETGELVIASNTGSQLPNLVFNSPNNILVVGAQKIVPTLDEAMKRLEEHVIPLEDENTQQKYGMGTFLSKVLIYKKVSPITGDKVTIIIVKEKLGF